MSQRSVREQTYRRFDPVEPAARLADFVANLRSFVVTLWHLATLSLAPRSTIPDLRTPLPHFVAMIRQFVAAVRQFVATLWHFATLIPVPRSMITDLRTPLLHFVGAIGHFVTRKPSPRTRIHLRRAIHGTACRCVT